jgi:excisionase family DNA binding protein
MKKNQDIARLSYSVQEAAVAIGVSSRTVHDFVKDGTIPHFRMGTRVLIPADALREFIAQRTQKGGAA